MRVSDATPLRGFRLPTSPASLAAAVTGVLVFAQLVLFAGVQSVLPALDRGGRPFPIQRIPNGTSLSQPLDVRANGLDLLELPGTVAGPAQSGAIDVTLVELLEDGTERQVRLAEVQVRETCCTIAFQPLQDSAGRRYRLDLRIRDFDSSSPLSLWAVPLGRQGDRLTINGRRQAARLELSGSATEGTAVARLRRTSPKRRYLSFGWFLTQLVVLDAAIACCVAGLVRVFVNASDRPHR